MNKFICDNIYTFYFLVYSYAKIIVIFNCYSMVFIHDSYDSNKNIRSYC